MSPIAGLPQRKTLRIRDFSGGWNIRDAQPELAPNESPDLENVTLDERGGIAKRNGYVKYNTNAFNASVTVNGFYWASGGNMITQSGTKLYKDTGAVEFKTFTTSARAGFADFLGKLYIIHPIDGLFNYDGTTVTALAAGPKGRVLLPWQNRLWASDDPGNLSRIWFSAIADGTSWPIANWVDIREKDGNRVVALSGASGIDISGRPGFLASKNESTYRIYDSATGAYQTIDPSIGSASGLSVANLLGQTIFLSHKGIFWTDGVGKLREAGHKLQPLWDPQQIAFDQKDLYCAGVKGDRIRFSLPRAASTKNDLALEYHPAQGWIVPRTDAAAWYAQYGNNTAKLYFGHPVTAGRVYESDIGGSDDGAAIASYFQTRWFEPSDGILSRLRRLRLIGRGSGHVFIRKDFELTDGDQVDFDITTGAAIYDDAAAIYDNAATLYGPNKYEDYQDFYSLGTAKAISFRIEESSTDTTTGPQILGTGTAATIGAWGVYGIDVMFVPLGDA